MVSTQDDSNLLNAIGEEDTCIFSNTLQQLLEYSLHFDAYVCNQSILNESPVASLQDIFTDYINTVANTISNIRNKINTIIPDGTENGAKDVSEESILEILQKYSINDKFVVDSDCKYTYLGPSTEGKKLNDALNQEIAILTLLLSKSSEIEANFDYSAKENIKLEIETTLQDLGSKYLSSTMDIITNSENNTNKDLFISNLYHLFRVDNVDEIILHASIENFMQFIKNKIYRVNEFNNELTLFSNQVESIPAILQEVIDSTSSKDIIVVNDIVCNIFYQIKDIVELFVLFYAAKADALCEWYQKIISYYLDICNTYDTSELAVKDAGISVEEYTLYYDLFIEEKNAYHELFTLGALSLNESTGLVIVQEGLKDTIQKYIKKITDGLQAVWNRFDKFFDDKYQESLNQMAPIMNQELTPQFTMTNFPEYDIDAFVNIKLVEFQYPQMKEDLAKRETFLSKYYSALASKMQDGESIKDGMDKLCVKSRKDTQCTPELLQGFWKFITEDYQKYKDQIAKDLDTIKNSNKLIETVVDTVADAQTAVTGQVNTTTTTTTVNATGEATTLLESYLNEATPGVKPATSTPAMPKPGGVGTDKKDDTKVEYKDDPNAVSGEGKTEFTRCVTTYIKINTDIFSSKMRLLKNIRNEYTRHVRHYVNMKK